MATINTPAKAGKDKLENPYLEIIKSADYKKTEEIFTAEKPEFTTTPEATLKEYKVASHTIFDQTLRPKKTVNKDTGSKNAAGEPITATTMIDVARVAMPFQKIIVNRRVGFMLSEPVKTEAVMKAENTQGNELIKLIDKIQNDNKMDYKNKEVARRLMSELEVAEIWYLVPNEEANAEQRFTLKVKILSYELGDTLYPLFDKTGDMIAFARAYKLKEDKKDIEHYDVYTAEAEYKYANRGQWALDSEISPNPIPNSVGKIMIIYYSQPEPEWADVQSMISRMETLLSNHADMNDYYGSPMLTIQGKIQGFAAKGEQGKILELENGANAAYLALASEPASIKMEQENLEKYVYAMSQTPDITFEQMKGVGALSGVALRLLFLDAHMAVKMKEEIFGLGLQRRLNLIKATIGKVIDTKYAKVSEEIQLKPVITPYVPQNEVEMLENLSVALSSNIISTQTAIEQNPLVEDPDEERRRVESDEEANMKRQEQMYSMQNPMEEQSPKPKPKE